MVVCVCVCVCVCVWGGGGVGEKKAYEKRKLMCTAHLSKIIKTTLLSS